MSILRCRWSNTHESMIELQKRASKYIKAEESMKRETTVIGGGNNKNSKNRKTEQEYDAKDKYRKDLDFAPKKSNPGKRFTEYARLNAPRSQILMDIEKYRDLRWPNPLRTDPKKRTRISIIGSTRMWDMIMMTIDS